MGLIRFLLRLFKRKKSESEEFPILSEPEFNVPPISKPSFPAEEPKEAIEPEKTEEKQDALLALTSANKRFEALTSANYRLEEPKTEEKLEISKPSLELGVAAGYVGRAIKDIELSLQRIESQMATKDWVVLNVLDPLKSFLNEKFEELKGLLLEKREKLMEKEKEFVLSEKMRKILDILKERGENGISYVELSQLLGISVSSLRGLLSLMCKHVKNIERFSIGKQGWVRLKEQKSSDNIDY